MLDNEVKNILEEQFSKERNYQRVLNNVNKKQIAYSKILKIVLLPTCAAIFAAIMIPNMNNKPSEFSQGIAQANTVTNTIIIEQDNNSNTIVEVPTIEVETGKSNENKDNRINEKPEDNTLKVQVAKGTIYKTIEGGESSWAYDPTIPSNLINDHSENKCVVRVKVLSVGEGEMLPKQENLYNPFTCFTPIKMQMIDNLLETNTLSGTITAYITGGKMKIANILKGTKQEIEYMGIYDISQIDPEQYIEYKWATPYYEPNVNDEYVMIINKTNPNLNQIMCGGYGIFKVEKQDNGKEIYRNVISEKILEM